MGIHRLLASGLVVSLVSVLAVVPPAAADHSCHGGAIEISQPAGVRLDHLDRGAHQWFSVFLRAGDYVFAAVDPLHAQIDSMWDGHCFNTVPDGYVVFFSPVSFQAPQNGVYHFIVYSNEGGAYRLTWTIVPSV